MALFHIKNKTLTPISEKKFDLERDIQKLTEANLETVFGLTFVSGATNQEFSVRAQEQDFYIDTLAFDEEQKSIVIIEYKKDKSISVIDQGFAYLSAMLNHKADFVLEINERLGRSYTKKDIDWEQSRVIYVSPDFTNYQRNAINFKDLPIYLYEVKIYENDIVDYNPIKPYRTTESINKISKDKTIQNVSREVKVYAEEDLLSKGEKAKELYMSLKEKLQVIDPSFVFQPRKNYIGVQVQGNWRNIIYINFLSNKLSLSFARSQPSDFTDPKKQLVYSVKSMKNFGQHITWFDINEEEDVLYAVELFKQAYERFKKEFA